MSTHLENTPLLVFPCHYPIKVIGDASSDFKTFVLEAVRRYDPSLLAKDITLQNSRNGNFISARVNFYATGKEQIEALSQHLKTFKRVKMVL